MVATKSETKQDNADVIQAVVNVNEGAYNAQKQVNLQLMRKIGQLVIAQKPEELVCCGDNIYWKVPLSVVDLSGDKKKYPLQSHAWVDAISGRYTMSNEFTARIQAESTPILRRLYPASGVREKPVREGA